MRKTKTNASNLDVFLQVEAYTSVPDGMGGNARTWSVLVDKLPARDVTVQGQEQYLQGSIDAKRQFRYEVRARTDITTNMRLVLNGRRMNIRAIVIANPRDRFMFIDAEDGVANG